MPLDAGLADVVVLRSVEVVRVCDILEVAAARAGGGCGSGVLVVDSTAVVVVLDDCTAGTSAGTSAATVTGVLVAAGTILTNVEKGCGV